MIDPTSLFFGILPKNNQSCQSLLSPVGRKTARLIAQSISAPLNFEQFAFERGVARGEVTRAVFNKNKADWRVIKAVSLINELNKKEIGVDSVGFSSSSAHIRAVVDDSVEVFMPVTADPSYLSASLQTIISRFRIEGNFIAKVDFRFDKPVVILKNE